MRLRGEVIEPFQGLWHDGCGQIPEVIEAHAYQFFLGKLLRTFKSKSPPSCNEARILSLFLCLVLIRPCPTYLWVLQNYLKNSYSITCQLKIDPSGRLEYHMKTSLQVIARRVTVAGHLAP